MVLADWTLINSGTVKEAYILLLAMNFCGFLTLLLGHSIVGGKGRKLLQAFFANVLFLAIAMPVWSTFFHALQNSLTIYDAGGAWQLQPSLLIGLFAEFFFAVQPDEAIDPSKTFTPLESSVSFQPSRRSSGLNRLEFYLSFACFCFRESSPIVSVRLRSWKHSSHRQSSPA